MSDADRYKRALKRIARAPRGTSEASLRGMARKALGWVDMAPKPEPLPPEPPPDPVTVRRRAKLITMLRTGQVTKHEARTSAYRTDDERDGDGGIWNGPGGWD